jgi:hypothetical protein
MLQDACEPLLRNYGFGVNLVCLQKILGIGSDVLGSDFMFRCCYSITADSWPRAFRLRATPLKVVHAAFTIESICSTTI